jgi:riboflavin transporter FmnP
MQGQSSDDIRSARDIQIKYLAQALITIAVTGLMILLLSSLFPFELTGRYFRTTEIYFFATIANLVFFHTLSYHIVDETTGRVVFGTAIATLITSALMYASYYLFALWQ